MPRLSFRTKLIAAMALVVGGVTATTIWLTQRRVQKSYQNMFEEQFATQLKFFSESRLSQLDEAARRCETVAETESVVEALKSGDADECYKAVLTALRELYKPQDVAGMRAQGMLQPGGVMRPPPGSAGPGGPGPGPGPGPGAPGFGGSNGSATGKGAREKQKEGARKSARVIAVGGGLPIIRVIDPGGHIFDTKLLHGDPLRELGAAKHGKELQAFLRMDRPLAEILREQEIGFTEFPGAGARNDLHVVIVTPIQSEGKFLGAMALAYPVGDLGEHAMYGFSEKSLLSGIWLNGKIYSDTIPEEVEAEVNHRISDEIENKRPLTGSSPVMIDGVPYRLFSKLLHPDSPFPPTAQVCLYSMTEVMADQAHLRNMGIGVGALSLVLASGLILLISHGFSKPIEQLAEATRRIREGDYALNLPVRSHDEVGALAASFNEMSRELALKERYKTVLAQVTDREVADQLISGTLALGGEVRQVSVLFCDIRGFTPLTENMPPAEVIAMLNEHMTAMNRIVHLHYGMVDKFVGDLIMAVFGAPKSYGNDALHAVKCALDMIAERRRLNGISRHQIQIGIGVATGEVVAGCMGSNDRLNYTVLGERVNLASRLCSNAEGSELLIDDNTYAQLPADFRVQPMEPMALKGFKFPTPAFRLLRDRDQAEIVEALA